MISHSLLTSPQVLALSSDLVRQGTQVIFLDEFQLVVLPDGWSNTELTAFNTAIPQDHPGSLRRLELPSLFYHWTIKIRVDNDRQLGAPKGCEPLIADPAQVVLVMELTRGWNDPVFLVVSMRAVIEETCSTRAGSGIPWDEWGRDAVALEVPTPGWTPRAFVHGPR